MLLVFIPEPADGIGGFLPVGGSSIKVNAKQQQRGSLYYGTFIFALL